MTDAPLYLSRATLRRDVPASALRALLVPAGDSARAGAGHRLVWTLFGDRPDRERDFLWREDGGGTYYFLSRRPPEDRHGLFALDEAKPFAPALAAGDRLHFSLRVNATVSRKSSPDQRRGKPSDVVMDALYKVPSGARAEARHDAIGTSGLAWLAAQGARSGFSLPQACRDDDGVPTASVRVTAYRTLRVEHAGPEARIGVLDFEGMLEVREPALFVAALGQGFGRAKAFGNGLMLVRRP